MENKRIQTFDIEDSRGRFVTNRWKMDTIWKDYIEELYNRKNRPQIIEMETEDMVEKVK